MVKKIVKNALKILLPFVLGGLILWWVYKDFDFSHLSRAVQEMSWTWLFISLIFEVLGHVFRGIRWQQTLEPLGLRPRTGNCINAIFFSYASNFVIPRLGEVSRCGVLAKYDGISFSKSLGTVVTERLVDTLILGTAICCILLFQHDVFSRFFERTGTNVGALEDMFLSSAFWISVGCVCAVVALGGYLLRKLAVFRKVKGVFVNIWEGILSLRHVDNLPLFAFWSLAIWACYFLQFYLTFLCFPTIAELPLSSAFVIFAAGSVAVVVPTPNGTGSWHFAIISMMMLYGVSETDAGFFALIVHGSQTLMLILLGIWSLVALPLCNRTK